MVEPEGPEPLTAEERALLVSFRKLTDRERATVRLIVDTMLEPDERSET